MGNVPMPSAADSTPPEWDDRRRSRVTRGKEILPKVDLRSASARRYRDIASLITADQGGEEHIAEVRNQMIRRFSAACVMAEEIEARLINGKPFDIDKHALLSSTMVRIASRIGLGRRMRTITPSLQEYLEANEDAQSVSEFELQRRRARALHEEAEVTIGGEPVEDDDAAGGYDEHSTAGIRDDDPAPVLYLTAVEPPAGIRDACTIDGDVSTGDPDADDQVNQ